MQAVDRNFAELMHSAICSSNMCNLTVSVFVNWLNWLAECCSIRCHGLFFFRILHHVLIEGMYAIYGFNSKFGRMTRSRPTTVCVDSFSQHPKWFRRIESGIEKLCLIVLICATTFKICSTFLFLGKGNSLQGGWRILSRKLWVIEFIFELNFLSD